MTFTSEFVKEMWREKGTEMRLAISKSLQQECEHGIKPKSSYINCRHEWQHDSYINNREKNLARTKKYYKLHREECLVKGARRWKEKKYYLYPFKQRYQARYFVIYNLYRNKDGRIESIKRNLQFEEQLLAMLSSARCVCGHPARFHRYGFKKCNVCECSVLYSREIAKKRKQLRAILIEASLKVLPEAKS
jgi:hypothetical protein